MPAQLSVYPRVLTFASELSPGVMQLLEQLDGLGLRQTVLTGRLRGTAARGALGQRGTIRRLGVPGRGGIALLKTAAAVRLPALSRTADLLHAYPDDEVSLGIAVAAAAAWGIPVVVSGTDAKPPESGRRQLPEGLRRAIGRAALGRADAALASSREEAERMVAAGADAQRVHVLGGGLEPEQRAAVVLEIYRAVWARYLAQQVAVWHPTAG